MGVLYRVGVRRSQTTAEGIDSRSATRRIAVAALLLATRGPALAVTSGKRGNGMDSSFRINEGPVDAETYALEPYGELDIATAPELAAALDAAVEAGRRFVVLDLADVRFLDASSLRVMVAAHRRLVEEGGRLVIVCSARPLVRVFEITGLIDVLSVTSSRREALSRERHLASLP